MKILMINSVCGIRSTGRICTDIAEVLSENGHEVKIAYGRECVPEKYVKYAKKIGKTRDIIAHALKARVSDCSGGGSKRATERLIEWIQDYNPDVIHLHNVHGYFINVEVLFNYLKQYEKKVIWTLHDCWAFTGHCAYFDYIGCQKWKKHCQDCELRNEYPKSLISDRSYFNYEKKKNLFGGINNLTIVTPSKWLAGLIEQSFLSGYSVCTIYNGIDVSTFAPVGENIKSKYGLEGKHIVLGVAAVWNKRKGFKDFLKLASILDESYTIVLVGISQKQKKQLPFNVRGILHTNSVQELVELYSCADVFVNPTYEDNYPTTNLEAMACGTPVVTYNTGGSVESAVKYGIVVEKGNVQELRNGIVNIVDKGIVNKLQRDELAVQNMVKQYIDLYINEKG